MSVRTLLFDSIDTGHHYSYARAVIRSILDGPTSVHLAGNRTLLSALQSEFQYTITAHVQTEHDLRPNALGKQVRAFGRVLRLARDQHIDNVHILYLDRSIVPLWLAAHRLGDIRLFGTLHWAYLLDTDTASPIKRARNAVELQLLKGLVRKGMKVMVHSKRVRDKFNQFTRTTGFHYIPYPTDPDARPPTVPVGEKNAIRERLQIPKRSQLMLCFGGTRRDKGADFAISVLPHLDSEVHLLIAGREEHFTHEALVALAIEHGVAARVHFDLRHIPDDEVSLYFTASDIVLLPYRREFSGQSGPLTIAASLGVPVVGPRTDTIGETIEGFSLGSIFDVGDVRSLASAIRSELGKHYTQSDRTASRHLFRTAHGAEAFGRTLRSVYSFPLSTSN